jgi:hypothetical protein
LCCNGFRCHGGTAGGVPVLADRVPRGAERVLARLGLLASAAPVFTACAQAPLAELLLALPALAATGLAETAHEVYGKYATGFYSLDTMLCDGCFGRCWGRLARRARAGAGAAVGPGTGGQDDPSQDRLARRDRQGRRLDRRDGASSCPGPRRTGGGVLRRRACARLSGHPAVHWKTC